MCLFPAISETVEEKLFSREIAPEIHIKLRKGKTKNITEIGIFPYGRMALRIKTKLSMSAQVFKICFKNSVYTYLSD